MRVNKKLLQAILKGLLPRKYAPLIKQSSYVPLFMKMPFNEYFIGSFKSGTVKATREEIEELKKYIDVKSIEIGIEE